MTPSWKNDEILSEICNIKIVQIEREWERKRGKWWGTIVLLVYRKRKRMREIDLQPPKKKKETPF